MIKREKYLNELIKAKNDGFPKVITGIRRCGKSFLLKDIYSSYLKQIGVKENEIILIELDDDKNSRLRNPIELGNYVRKVTANNKMNYVILDEIQRVYTIINPTLTEGKIVLAKANDTETNIAEVSFIPGMDKSKLTSVEYLTVSFKTCCSIKSIHSLIES